MFRRLPLLHGGLCETPNLPIPTFSAQFPCFCRIFNFTPNLQNPTFSAKIAMFSAKKLKNNHLFGFLFRWSFRCFRFVLCKFIFLCNLLFSAFFFFCNSLFLCFLFFCNFVLFCFLFLLQLFFSLLSILLQFCSFLLSCLLQPFSFLLGLFVFQSPKARDQNLLVVLLENTL